LQCGTRAKFAPFPSSEKIAATEKTPITTATAQRKKDASQSNVERERELAGCAKYAREAEKMGTKTKM
jgi:hypothetical protein